MTRAKGGPSGDVFTYTDNVGLKSASFTTKAYDVGEARHLVMTVDAVTVAGTTPTCDVTIETSTDRINWYPTGRAFAQITSVGHETIPITKGYKDEVADVEGLFHRHVRANCVIGGTTPTFSLAFYVTGSP